MPVGTRPNRAANRFSRRDHERKFGQEEEGHEDRGESDQSLFRADADPRHRPKAAILDLLDNCVDGIHRHLKAGKGLKPYKKFYAKMKFDGAHFELLDNCGGITRARLRQSALRLGRPNADADGATYTVGAYGIGLKRAIFKLGREAEISSYHTAMQRRPSRRELVQCLAWHARF